MKKLYVFVLCIIVVLSSTAHVLAQWSPKGNTLVGTAVGGMAGYSVSMTPDGNTIAIGIKEADMVRVYTYSAGNWVQKGGDIVGNAQSSFGGSVAISDDGNTLIVGAYANNSFSGQAKVFVFSMGSWSLKGTQFDGSTNSRLGNSVSISADGNTIAIGKPGFDNLKGQVAVYTFSAGAWAQKGNLLNGSADDYIYYGSVVSLSSDGNTLAVGSPSYSGSDTYSEKGRVLVYSFSSGAWSQKGGDVYRGTTVADHAGYSIDLSADGNTVVFGINFNFSRGMAKVFAYASGAWTQKGGDLSGDDFYEDAGYSVALSADGNTVAIGTPNANSNAGNVKVFGFSAGWVLKGNTIAGEASSKAGSSVDLSANGNTVALGAVNFDNQKGQAKVYSYSPMSITKGNSTNPTCLGNNGSISFASAGYASTTQTLNFKKNNVSTSQSVMVASNGNFTLTGLGIGTYSEFAIGAVYASGGPVELTGPVAPPVPVPTVNSPVCANATIILGVSSGTSYAWAAPDGFVSALQNPTRSNATPMMSGKYSVSVTAANACVSSATILVQVNTISAQASSSGMMCSGSLLKLFASGGTSYAWTGPGFSSTQQNPTRPSATPAMSGTYSVVIGNGTCTTQLTTSVIVSPSNSLPSITSVQVNGTLPNAQNTVTVCNNLPVSLTIAATNALTYSWKGPAGAGSGFVSSVVSPVTMPISNPKTGQFTISVRNGCASFNHRVINIQLSNCGTRIASTEAELAIEVSTYPNPVSDQLHVAVQLPEAQPLRLQLLNMAGQASGQWSLDESTRTHRTQLDLRSLPPGMYLLQAESEQYRATKKILKVR